MLTVGIYEAKKRLSELLRRVSEGESITITKHGVPVAKIGPVNGKKKKDRRSVVERMKEFRKGRTTGGMSIREMIEEGRRF
jgi:prevent-host-death family protein